MTAFTASRGAFMAGSVALAGLMLAGRRAGAASVLKVRNPQDIKSIDPMTYSTNSEINVGLAVLNGLIRYQPVDKWEWALVPPRRSSRSIRPISPSGSARASNGPTVSAR